MLEKLKHFERWSAPNSFPSGVVQLVISRLRVLGEFLLRTLVGQGPRRWQRKIAKRLAGSKRGKVALVLGNGPSLDLLDIKRVLELQNQGVLDIFVVNLFCLTSAAKKISPDFYFLSDPGHKRTQHMTDPVRSLWGYISNQPSISLCLPAHWKNPIASIDECLPMDDRSLEGWSRNTAPYRPRGYPSLTAFKALAWAVHLGYDQIFILGWDNNLFQALSVDDKNSLFQGSHHAGRSGKMSHRNIDAHHPGGVADYFFDLAYSSYLLRKLFSSNNIVNLDPRSFTDAFSKQDPLRIVSGAE